MGDDDIGDDLDEDIDFDEVDEVDEDIDEDELRERRERMVAHTIEARGIVDPRVLAAMRTVPRHRFVPDSERSAAYIDSALPIGHDATISQPYMVAEMSELASIQPGDRVLEIGTGSGYQAAVLAEMGAEVYSVERVGALAEQARQALEELGYGDRVHVRHADGYAGWREHAPFQVIMLTASPSRVPQELIDQLAVGGRLIAPVGASYLQSLMLIERTPEGTKEREVSSVVFVPMLPGTREE